MATTTNYGWTTPNDTDLVKDGASAIRTLGSAIDSTVFTNASAGIAKTLIDAKGDLIAGSAADTAARLAVGTNGQVLIADSAESTGLKWGSASPSYTYTTFTPVLKQGATTFTLQANGTGTSYARYVKIGNMVHVQATVVISSGTGTSNNPLLLEAPVSTTNPGSIYIIGVASIYDASADTNSFVSISDGWSSASPSSWGFLGAPSTNKYIGQTGSQLAVQFTTNDTISIDAVYAWA
jgi:hypothetical protein